MEETLKSLKTLAQHSGLKLVTVIVVFFLGIMTIRNVLKIVKNALVTSSLDNALVNFILTLLRFGLYFGLILYCLKYLGVNLTGVLTTATAVTLAIGLALQNIIASVANGVMIAATHPFRIKDYVEIGSQAGTVEEVNLMHTIINSIDGKRIYIPNSSVFQSSIVNWSSNKNRRVDISIGVDYSSDQEKAREVILQTAAAHPLVLKSPAPQDRYNLSDASSVIHILKVWVKTVDYWTVNYDLTEQTFEALKAAGIGIPFPQVTVSYREEEKS